jgi:enoyl-CoA hydratase
MTYSALTLDVADRIATISTNRPDKLNALNDQLITELGAAMDEVAGRDDVAGVILTGTGRAFVAGADIGEVGKSSPAQAKALARKGQEVFRRFEVSAKPTVAAVNGFALGGGCELAMACHVRVASEAAKFGQPEVKLGLIPGYGGTQRLPRLVGKGRALQLLLTGEMIDAQEAYRIGLANAVVPAGELMDRARALVTAMIANAPIALAFTIETVNAGYDLALDEALRFEATAFGLAAATEDMTEGTTAFLEKRAPRFQGR